MGRTGRHLVLYLLVASLLAITAQPYRAAEPASHFYNAPKLLTYAELIELCSNPEVSPALKGKVDELLTTPIISSEFGTEPGLRVDMRPEAFLRMAQWNIAQGRSIDLIKAAIAAPEEYLEKVIQRNPKRYQPGTEALKRLSADLSLLRTSDIIVLNEVDLGIGRTDYRDIARELAQVLQMNYTYGVEFIEVDPTHLGLERKGAGAAAGQVTAVAHTEVDPSRYLGLHGTAILSRYPILDVRMYRFQHQGYDWYHEEKEELTLYERGRRGAASKIFIKQIHREIRRGGRMALLADIAIPALPEGKLTVVATHLENRAKPSSRTKQLKELLELIEPISNPVVLAGDMNTTGRDERPTSVRRELFKRASDKEFWAGHLLRAVGALSIGLNLSLSLVGAFKTQRDPTGRHIPLVTPNPEHQFFKTLREFRFKDGYVFDFRGDESRTSNGTAGTLANSNERALKGFSATHIFGRPLGPIGKYKLDWFFVKSYLRPGMTDPASYRFAPHFPRVLREFNNSVPGQLSDHHPITLDLPFAAPEPTPQEVAVSPAGGETD